MHRPESRTCRVLATICVMLRRVRSRRCCYYYYVLELRSWELRLISIAKNSIQAPQLSTRPKKFMCFQLQSGEKVGTRIFFNIFSFHDIPCNVTKKLTKTDTLNITQRELKKKYCSITD